MRSRRLLAAALGAGLIVTGSALAAPPEDRVLSIEQYTTEKGRALGQKYAAALRELNAGIYHCMPWVGVEKEGIGFFRPRHMDSAVRYLSLRITVDQAPSQEFAQWPVERRASAMFSRYVGPLLRRMTAAAGLLSDSMLDGFTVIIDWLQPLQSGAQSVTETIAVFIEKRPVSDYVAGRAMTRDLAQRAVVFGYDGKTALGQLKVAGWEDNFVKTFHVANYQPEPGVTCR